MPEPSAATAGCRGRAAEAEDPEHAGDHAHGRRLIPPMTMAATMSSERCGAEGRSLHNALVPGDHGAGRPGEGAPDTAKVNAWTRTRAGAHAGDRAQVVPARDGQAPGADRRKRWATTRASTRRARAT